MKSRGMGSVYLRGQVWWVRYHFRGRQLRESSRSSRRTDAVKLLRRRMEEMGRGALVGPEVERTTFADLAAMLLNDYHVNGRKSLRRAESSCQNLRAYFDLHRAVDITTDRITAYIRWRLEESPRCAKPATIQNELAALKRMFSLAQQGGKVDRKPHIPSVKVRNVRSGFFEEPDLRAVLSHLPSDLQPVIEFAHLTGWRIGEVLALSWDQVDLGAGRVRLEPGTTKNDEGRVFPFDVYPELAHVITRQRERTTAVERERGAIVRWVFHRRGKRIAAFRGAWARACKQAGVPGRLVHDLRRTAVRNLERAGVPRSVAMKLTGHKTENVYRRYAIVAESDLADGVKKLAALHERPSEERKVVVFRTGTGTEPAH